MNKLTEKVFMIAPYGYFTYQDITTLFPESEDKRYGLIKRAIAHNEIIHLRRGFYCLAPKYQKKNINLFALAMHIYGPSYISLESALSYHNWIPEAVYAMTGVSSGISKDFKTPLGTFMYSHVPQKVFYSGVERVTDDAGDVFFMADPMKALADYVYIYRKDWKGLKPIYESLRVEPEELALVTSDMLDVLLDNYISRRVLKFLRGVKKDLRL